MLKYILVILAAFLTQPVIAQMSSQEAFSIGSEAASALQRDQATGALQTTKAAEVIPGFDPAARPSQAPGYSGDIVTTLRNTGTSAASDCGEGRHDNSLGAAQHCEAVNSMTRSSTEITTSPVTINDPIITKSDEVLSNPEAIAGKIETAYSGCFEKQVTIPAATMRESCDVTAQLSDMTCISYPKIVVDPDYIYKCNESHGAQDDITCSVISTYKIDTDTKYLCEISSNVSTHDCKRTAVISYTPSTHPSPTTATYGMLHYDVNGIKDKYESYIGYTTVTLTPSQAQIEVKTDYARRCAWAENNEQLEARVEVIDPDGISVGIVQIKGGCVGYTEATQSFFYSQGR